MHMQHYECDMPYENKTKTNQNPKPTESSITGTHTSTSPPSSTDTHCHLHRTCMKYSISPHLIVWSAMTLYKLLHLSGCARISYVLLNWRWHCQPFPCILTTLKTWLPNSQRTIRVSLTMGAGASVLPPGFREPTKNREDHSLQQMPFKAEAHCSTAENRCEKLCV